MMTTRCASACGQADFGWLQARYSFSFGHYFDPKLMGYASLRVLNQEVLAPGAAFQPRSYPQVDVLNLVLQGEAEYRDSEGNHLVAREGEAMLLSARQGVNYSEINISKDHPLTRMQLWLAACPDRENPLLQKIAVPQQTRFLLASPDGVDGSLQLRQQVWVHQVILAPGEQHMVKLNGPRAYLQSIHGSLDLQASSANQELLSCGDGAFLSEEQQITLQAKTPLRALVIDLPA
ncbi:pirin family protein [Pantoea sp. JGM49]|uniref:pirin family protein n=1 Tax=unclassified Pantoea TaxID=2630326 RepID=UPI0013237501|nr:MULTISPECIES: pirin family protein [unclassified Pantoea]MBS0881017.1 pirin family protein [Pantoea sp. JGM49]MDI9279318.1 pirin family protein [Pantoea sp. EABMAA-21]MXP54137.1 pirin family protein [Pantoea sp. Seng]